MELVFTKMHGLGNDFVVIDAVSQVVSLTTAQVRFIADRHFGVGCDQLLLVERPTDPQADFRYRIFNADGGEVEHCGNGARCFARFVLDRGLTSKRDLVVERCTGTIHLKVEDDGQVTVMMGVPRFRPEDIPFVATAEAHQYTLQTSMGEVVLGAVSIGNPHAVLRVPEVARAPVATLGPVLEAHPRFPARVNVGFMEIVDAGRIRLRVFERGVGETLACGTGACAAVAVGRRQELLAERVEVTLPGGTLVIRWSGALNDPLWMTGPVAYVFEGNITL